MHILTEFRNQTVSTCVVGASFVAVVSGRCPQLYDSLSLRRLNVFFFYVENVLYEGQSTGRYVARVCYGVDFH